VSLHAIHTSHLHDEERVVVDAFMSWATRKIDMMLGPVLKKQTGSTRFKEEHGCLFVERPRVAKYPH